VYIFLEYLKQIPSIPFPTRSVRNFLKRKYRQIVAERATCCLTLMGNFDELRPNLKDVDSNTKYSCGHFIHLHE
jgi:hypothetical protein